MLMPMMMSMNAASLALGSTGLMFGTNQDRLGLANGVTGSEPQAGVASIAAHDKALMFQGIQAQTNYQVALAMQDGAQSLRKKNQEQRERLMSNGALFV